VLTPELEEGPYYFDPELQRSDIREGHEGAPLRLLLQVVDAADCSPLSGVRVDVWHCDARGFYSGYEGQGDDQATSTVGQKFLRGSQLTGSDGVVAFDTIYPGWYRGRTTHIHVKVILGGGKVATSQLFFPDALSEFIYENVRPYAERKAARDTINKTDADVQNGGEGHATFCNVKEAADRYVATLIVGIDPTATAPGEPARPAGPPPDDEVLPESPRVNKARLVPGAT
jgi:protocatechuate 3,4-dioxygenase beta subunit